MYRMRYRALAVLSLLLVCLPVAAHGKKDDAPDSSVSFVVLKDDNGKPVRNAAVVLHPVGKNGKQERNGFELKTDADGKTYFDGIPYGVLRIQVIAPGFQTYGQDFNIGQPTQVITIRLKRPQQQYSIYPKSAGSGTAAPPTQQPQH